MPLIQSSQDYLPYIDAAPSQSELESARALIHASLPEEHKTTPHSSLPDLRPVKFSELVEGEHERLASGTERPPAIDMTRYEAQDAPSTNDPQDWRATLQKAYASSEYLDSRLTNLSLLETYGKNAWLISNDQLEGILRAAEREVAQRKIELEELDKQRRMGQEARKGELHALEESWKVGIGRMIEVEVAAEKLRLEILDRQRAGAR